ncbi:MAG TPA: sensor histidine kinase [Candidatus Paenibacillus intestinavium]|nr:sensor histidine kinase [Candidatus Paenibacillus intestinavium]
MNTTINFILQPIRKSIRTRLIVTMVFIAIIPTLAVTLLAMDNSRRSMETEVVNTNLSNLKWTGIYLDQQFEQLSNLMYSVLINPDMMDYLGDQEQKSVAEQYTEQKNIDNLLTSSYYSAKNHMVGVEVYVQSKQRIFTINSSGSHMAITPDKPYYFNMLANMNKDLILSNDLSDPDKFRMTRSINRFEDRERLGYISFDIRWSMFDQTLDLMNKGAQHTIVLIDGEGNKLYQPAGLEMSEATWANVKDLRGGPAVIRTDNEFIFYNTNELIDLTLIKVIPKHVVNQSATKTMQYGIIIGLLSVISTIIAAVFLGWKISYPIVHLARSIRGLNFMRKMEAPDRRRIDEIGMLENKLYNLQSRIQEHIKTEFSMNLDKKSAELKALQAQINPHFLQNTLQMIGSMIYTSTPQESYAVIRSLSEMFRYVIREPDMLATLSAEMAHLNHYMHIQQQRFKEKLQYTVEIDNALEHVLIPKLTLQPIVENAFFHGLENKTGAWSVHIRMEAHGDEVWIIVKDNGVGIKAETLQLLEQRLQSERDLWSIGNRIGLSNIVSRIKMRFGDSYGIDIASDEFIGTSVTVRIPIENGD